MALTLIEQVRLLIGLVPNSPFYSFLSDADIEWFLESNGNRVYAAARRAAVAVSLQLAGVNTREITGDIHVYNEVSKQYLAALDNLINDSSINNLPNGLMPYASGISWEDWCANNLNPDNIRSPLSMIKACPEEGNRYCDDKDSEPFSNIYGY